MNNQRYLNLLPLVLLVLPCCCHHQVVLEGQKVLPTRAQQAGFNFKYTELPDALRNLLK
jgi:NAD dependent epimerase/dehydratase family enzyme